jgi:hypothetical protein
MTSKSVTDSSTDQKAASARPSASDATDDREAMEASGPKRPACGRFKRRVRASMDERDAAAGEKPVEKGAEELSALPPGRGDILAQLWEVANLSPEATGDNIDGQLEALRKIAAIEGLIRPN